jgi:transposase
MPPPPTKFRPPGLAHVGADVSTLTCLTCTSGGTRAARTPPDCARRSASAATGSERTVRRHLQDIRASGKPAPDNPDELTVRRATWLITSHTDHLEGKGTLKAQEVTVSLPRAGRRRRLRPLLRRDDERAPRQRPGRLAHQRRGHWLQASVSLARGLRQDFDAVAAGLTLEWSSGKVEGNVNRVKRIKRDGYGRAGSDLLRLQILLAD